MSLIKDQEEDKVVSNLFQSRICQNLFEGLPGVSRFVLFVIVILFAFLWCDK